jgi:hypothetical protein
MNKTLLLPTAAAMLLCSIAPAYAGTVKYTFVDSGGVTSCNGITLTETATTAVGENTGCSDPDYAGGFPGKLAQLEGDSDKQWIITTTQMTSDPGNVYVFVLDQKALTYQLWREDTTSAVTFQLLNSGTLKKGTPPMEVGHNGAKSLFR